MATETLEKNLMQIDAKLKIIETDVGRLDVQRAELMNQRQQLIGAKEAFTISLNIVREAAGPPPPAPEFAFDKGPEDAQGAREEKPEEPKRRVTRGRKKKVTISEDAKAE